VQSPWLTVMALLLLPGVAFAHPGHEGLGVLAGVLHPLTGLDHVVAMLAVGLWAAQLNGRLRVLLPLAFTGVMLLGAVAATGGGWSPAAFTPLSALLLAAAAVYGWRPATILMSVVTAGFALLHGWAHSTESFGAGYVFGMLSAAVALQGLGLLTGRLIQRTRADRAMSCR
jgi:urease accessory protein